MSDQLRVVQQIPSEDWKELRVPRPGLLFFVSIALDLHAGAPSAANPALALPKGRRTQGLLQCSDLPSAVTLGICKIKFEPLRVKKEKKSVDFFHT